MSEKSRRSKALAYALICACVDKTELNKVGVNEHIFKNMVLYNNVITLVNRIQIEITRITKVNIQPFNEKEIMPPDLQQAIDIASVIKSETSQSGYTRLRQKLLEDGKVKLPTNYMLLKSIPKIVPFFICNDDNKNPWYDSSSYSPLVCIN